MALKQLVDENLPSYQSNHIWRFLGPGFFILSWTEDRRSYIYLHQDMEGCSSERVEDIP